MPLIVIGELVKKIDKITDQSLLKKYPDILWGEIKGMRNIVVRDYFNIDAEEIFNLLLSVSSGDIFSWESIFACPVSWDLFPLPV